ncbi:MAG: hydrolase [Gemmatimonadales bacterium]
MELDTFRPAWWLRGPHAQTLGARMLRSRSGIALERERIELPDGDFLDLDWAHCVTDGVTADGPLVVVLHGLEGCARSNYALELYRTLGAHGLRAVGLNFRSCSGEPNRLPRMYHSGETGDIASTLELLAGRNGTAPLGIVGVSLGGNALLKYLGERGGTRKTRVTAAVAVSVPYDLAAGSDHIERGFSKFYRMYLVHRLRKKILAKSTILEGHIDVGKALRARTFREFDDRATAPLHGFKDADDYYARSSASHYLGRIDVPTLLIHALDDPFLPAGSLPIYEAKQNPHIEISISERGGHIGFVSGKPWAPVFWAEQRAAEFLAGKLNPDCARSRSEG